MKTTLMLALGLLAFTPTLRAAGQDDLIRLYEEEILAHDLYVALGKIYPDIMPLRNIPQSEQMHRAAMPAILKADGITIPKARKKRQFVTPGLDKTYKKWLAEGKKSELDACRVGVRLEDHDIADLRKAQRDFPAHKEVLAQLEAASNNHLRAFHRNLSSRGGTYTAEALPAEDIQAILNDSNSGCGPSGGCGAETCGKGNGNAKQGKGNGMNATRATSEGQHGSKMTHQKCQKK